MKLVKSERAEAEVVGHAIILSITILGIGMITLYGVPAIYSLEDSASTRNVEQSFTVLDSHASRVTLGESPIQMTSIDLGGGTLTVEPNSTNHPSYMVVNGSNFNVTIPMGKIKYTLGDRIVAYEDGGVWSKYSSGSTVMLSPPEFHYEGVTLTLPVFNFSGSNSVGGEGSAAVSVQKNASLTLFPNSIPGRKNPVNFTQNPKVFVNITSDYYLGWADYARGLGYIIVSKNDTTHTTSMELSVVPTGLGERSPIWNPITMRGLNESNPEPLDNFSFRIYNDKDDGSWDNSIDWDIRAVSGTKGLIFAIQNNGHNNVDLTIGYTKDYTDNHVDGETWGTSHYTPQNDTYGKYYIDVDLLNKSVPLNYSNQNVGSNNAHGNCTILGGVIIKGIADPASSWGNDPYIAPGNANSTQFLYNITEHYINKMAQDGAISFYQCASGTNSPDSDSTMLLNYSTKGALTYLHITDNMADVKIH